LPGVVERLGLGSQVYFDTAVMMITLILLGRLLEARARGQTSAAIMVGTGKGAEYGVLFKNSGSLETAHQLQAIVLDKTGTLTQGKPAVTDIVSHFGYTESDVLRLAAAAERGSEHPLGQALLDAATTRQLGLEEAQEFHVIPGQGIHATVGSHAVWVGNAAFMQSQQFALDNLEEEIMRL
jgi:Cu+-exporting ATPase